MAEPDDALLALAGSISDGTDVAWDAEEARTTDDTARAVVQSLRVVDLVSRLQRGSRTAPTPSDAGLPLEHWGTYEILERIGGGSYGEVSRAWDPRLCREVALKILKPRSGDGTASEIERILREGRRLSSVRHPNVVAIHAVEEIEGRPAIVMERVRGRTLSDIVREAGPFGPEEVVAIGTQLCRALAAVHAAGLVHQDVKAQNVMREEGGRIVLMDFGSGGATALTSAPEVLDGKAPTVASDLYGLGVLLFQLLCGTYPVVGRSLAELKEAHSAGRATRLRDARPGLPGALVEAIERAIAADPTSRFRTAGDMEAALAGRASPTRTTRAHSHRVLVAAGATIVFVGLLSAIVGHRRETQRHGASTTSTAARPASAVPVAPTADSPAFEVEASVYRGRAQRELLVPGAAVVLGDSISATIESSESLYVYVLNEDDQGDAFLLFPSAETIPQNPLPPRVKNVLPGTRGGRPAYWQITSAGGREHLLFVASRSRLVQLESDLLLVDRPREGQPVDAAPLSAETKGRLRGLGGLVIDTTEVAGTNALFEGAPSLTLGSETTHGVWIRRIDLESRPR